MKDMRVSLPNTPLVGPAKSLTKPFFIGAWVEGPIPILIGWGREKDCRAIGKFFFFSLHSFLFCFFLPPPYLPSEGVFIGTKGSLNHPIVVQSILKGRVVGWPLCSRPKTCFLSLFWAQCQAIKGTWVVLWCGDVEERGRELKHAAKEGNKALLPGL
jgi:hypothetical protein